MSCRIWLPKHLIIVLWAGQTKQGGRITGETVEMSNAVCVVKEIFTVNLQQMGGR